MSDTSNLPNSKKIVLKTRPDGNPKESDFEIIESEEIQKNWSNSLPRKAFEVLARLVGFDIRQNVMFYCKLKARD